MELSMLGVSASKESQFNRKGIHTVQDLLNYLPIRFQDFSRETGILPENEYSCVVVRVEEVKRYYGRTTSIVAMCRVESTGEKISLWWFNQDYLYDRIQAFQGSKAFVAGKVKVNNRYNNYTIAVPQVFETVSEGKKIRPVYRKIPGMGDDYLRAKINDAFDLSCVVRETIPFDLLEREKLLPLQDALYRLHFPISMEQVQKAQERLVFDDLLYFALQNELSARSSSVGSPYQIKNFGLVNKIMEKLPYTLTKDQLAVYGGMTHYINKGQRLNALIQGDVGCRKSIVAFLLMAAFAESGFQALLMAPTQVLAQQHYDDLKALVEPMGYAVAYLGSDRKAAELREEKRRIASGEVNFIVGTTALLGKDIEYQSLALAIVDEEHRFGVVQRESLTEKASAGVHTISMSATPIPRSLAQILYGNAMQIYTIHSMPKGRKPILTGIQNDRNRIYHFLFSQIKKHHHQAYVVCPMIEASDSEVMAGVKSVDEVSQEYKNELEPLGIRIGTVTGKTKKEDLEETISSFKAGEIDILISTSIIEVGINIPNATAISWTLPYPQPTPPRRRALPD